MTALPELPGDAREREQFRRAVIVALIRVAGFLVAAGVLYAVVPVDLRSGSRAVFGLVASVIALGVLVAALGLLNHLPALFVALSVLTMVLNVLLVFFLWRRDTSAYLRAH